MADITNRGVHLYQGLFGEFPGPYLKDDIVGRRVQACSLIARHATTLHHYAEMECNGVMSPELEKREAQLQARVVALVASLGEGFSVHFNGDPRGFAVKICNPDGRYNTWGGAEDGWGV